MDNVFKYTVFFLEITPKDAFVQRKLVQEVFFHMIIMNPNDIGSRWSLDGTLNIILSPRMVTLVNGVVCFTIVLLYSVDRQWVMLSTASECAKQNKKIVTQF